MGKGAADHTQPALTYQDSMRVEDSNGLPICAMTQPIFDAWLESRILTADYPDALRARLAQDNLDTFFNEARWFAMLEVIKSGGSLTD